jgi:hypothetical protein
MKILLFLPIFLTFSSLLKAQELPEIPLKNGMAYYVFQHKLDNSAKCLSSYFDAPGALQLPLYQKIGNLTNEYTIEAKKNGKKGILNYSMLQFVMNSRQLKTLKCNDTLKNGATSLDVILNGELLWRPAFIELLRKKITRQNITANIGVVFISKNEYKLIIKDIQYSVYWMKGTQQGIDIYKLGEYYEKADKTDKESIKFFGFVDMIIKSADEIILKALTDTYQADEL